MKILAIDTSCKTAMVSLSENGTVIAAVQLHDNKTHSVKMLPAVEYVLSSADTKFEDLGALAVTTGPGSYTGLRIGVTTAKTLSYTLKIPLIGINTLEALAASCDFGGDFAADWVAFVLYRFSNSFRGRKRTACQTESAWH